jgi:hypothetical protein
MKCGFLENYFGIYEEYWSEEVPEVVHQPATRTGGVAYPLAAPPALVGPW